jgi:hypothetical protein
MGQAGFLGLIRLPSRARRATVAAAPATSALALPAEGDQLEARRSAAAE